MSRRPGPGHAPGTGIADLSLRQLAAAIGTSHRMLIYHLGSREGLLAAVTRAAEEQQACPGVPDRVEESQVIGVGQSLIPGLGGRQQLAVPLQYV